MTTTVKDEGSFRGKTVRVDGEIVGYVRHEEHNGRKVWWAIDKSGRTITYQTRRSDAVFAVTRND